MNPQDLRNWIDSLAQDISFEYRGKLGSIYTSVDDAMNSTLIGGKPLKEICTDIHFE